LSNTRTTLRRRLDNTSTTLEQHFDNTRTTFSRPYTALTPTTDSQHIKLIIILLT